MVIVAKIASPTVSNKLPLYDSFTNNWYLYQIMSLKSTQIH